MTMPATASIPSWLQTSPDDIANKFVSGLQIGAQLGEARNKLAQQAQQSAVENQVTQDKLASDAVETAQKLQVQQAYNDQQISLKQQEVAAAQEKVKNETMKAAAMFQAQQGYKNDFQSGLDMGLSSDDAARASFMKNLMPVVSGAAGASAMRGVGSNSPQVPQFMTSPKGAEIGFNPKTGHFIRTDTGIAKPGSNFDWTKFDATQIGRELSTLQKTQASLGPDDPGSADRASRMAMLNQKLEGMRAGNAPSGMLASESSSPTSHTEAPVSSTSRVTVKSPDGKIGTIPAGQLGDALKAGFQQVK